jgi:hypothetical protein
MFRNRGVLGWMLVLALLATSPGSAAPPVDLSQLIAELDSDEFDRRDEALTHLLRLSDDPQQLPQLAEQVQKLLASPDTSYEVRAQLAPLIKKLGAAVKVAEPTTAELNAAIEALDHNEFTQRAGAGAQIELWLSRDLAVGPIFARLKQRQYDDANEPSRELLDRLTALANRARGAWLTADVKRWPLPPIEDKILAELLDTISRDPIESESNVESARQELLDRLSHPPDVDRVVAALKERLASPELPVDARTRLDELLQWTKPAMVAEIWNGNHHRTIQHLLIDVPAQVAGAPNPTHFDKIDDRTAHCVTGNSLTLGDWPVGVYFPSPRTPAWSTQFFLFNLPTARARLAYERHVERPEHERFRELSQRSTARWLADRAALSPGEIIMLSQLDRATILDFVPRYLRTVDDATLDVNAPLPDSLQSRHSLLCLTLGLYGDQAVGRALCDAALQKRVDCPAGLWPRLAIVAIGTRDGWPGLDSVLAEIVADDKLTEEVLNQLDIRATAASLLLTRAGLSASAFGLEPDTIRQHELRDIVQQISYSDESRLTTRFSGNAGEAFVTPIFKFADEASRSKVLSWWRSREAAKPVRP